MEPKKKGSKNPRGKPETGRRSFLKKAAYSAPVLLAMGQLVKPESAHAESQLPPPPGL
jgi:hypothetical protein